MALSVHRPLGWSLRRRPHPAPRGPLRIAMFTTSYPRDAADLAGRFVFNTVEHLRGRDVEVEVVAPGSYRDFGLTGVRGGGVVAAVKRRPWLAVLLLVSIGRACRAAARPLPRRRAPRRPRACQLARRRRDRALQRPPVRRDAPRLGDRRALLGPLARAPVAPPRPPAAGPRPRRHLLLRAARGSDARLRAEERARHPLRGRRAGRAARGGR